jgi:hypothetical protein
MLKTVVYYLLLMFHEIYISFYHNHNFLFDIFLTRICLYSECWLYICVYNLQQHIKNDTDRTDVVENDYISLGTSTWKLQGYKVCAVFSVAPCET